MNELWPQKTRLESCNGAPPSLQVWPTSSIAFMMLYSRTLAILGVILGFFQKWAWGLTQGLTPQSRTCYLHHSEWQGNLNNSFKSSLSKTAQSESCILTFDQHITLPCLWFWTDDNALGNRVHPASGIGEIRIWFLRVTGSPLSKVSPQWMTSVFISIKWGEESNLALYIALRFTDKTQLLKLWCFV